MYPEPRLIIDNVARRGCGEADVPVIDPATEETLGTYSFAGPADVADALASAERGLAAWRRTGPWARADRLHAVAALIRERSEDISRLITLEVGKPLAEARLETLSAIEHFEWATSAARQLEGGDLPLRTASSHGRVTHEPVGIALLLTAWNFPVNLAARKLCMALAAGCSCILRPAPEAPACIEALVRCCIDAGLPEGAVGLLYGTPEVVVAPLMEASAVRKVSFTGSTRVGRLLIGQSAATIKRLTMELGGHAPVIVLDDADVASAAQVAGAAKFRNGGQVCTSPSRFIVHESVIDGFVEGMVEVARGLKLGNGMDPEVTMGPMATDRQRDRTEALMADARARGARVHVGGGRPAGFNTGYYFEPTVLTDVDPEADLMTKEPFCPIAPIVPFTRIDDAMALANGSEAGLAGYLFTGSARRAAEVSEALEVGVLGVNTCAVALPEAPFGGVKQSGYGREGGTTAIHDYLNTKFTHTVLA